MNQNIFIVPINAKIEMINVYEKGSGHFRRSSTLKEADI